MVFHGSRLVFCSSRSVFMVFMVPGGFSWFQVGFHGSRLVFHGSSSVFMIFKVPGWFFMVPGRLSCFFIVPGWFFISHIENTLKLYSGPTIQSRPCWP